MPGLHAFGRRWTVGSDDFVIWAIFLVVLHAVLIGVVAAAICVAPFNSKAGGCDVTLRNGLVGALSTLCVVVVVEATAAIISARGTIWNDRPRWTMEYVLYARLGVHIVEVAWQVLGCIWLVRYRGECDSRFVENTVIGVVTCQWILTASATVAIWLSYDEFGRIRDDHNEKKLSRTGNEQRRSVYVQYKKSWNRCLRQAFCCVGGERHARSLDNIARLFMSFFDLPNLVPSDVIAGLVLVRRHQRMTRRRTVLRQNDVTVDRSAYDILSSVSITPQTEFLDDDEADHTSPDRVGVNDFAKLIHYMRYAHAAYGWPMYLLANPMTGPCKLLSNLRCCSCSDCGDRDVGSTNGTAVEGDNCCRSNYVALRQLAAAIGELDVVYVTYRTDISQPSFYIAVDYREQAVVISIRGTLSVPDILTDLMANAEQMMLDGESDPSWQAHKGILEAARNTLEKIKAENLLEAAFERNPDRGTRGFRIIVVGHSLGAGTAAILAILLKQDEQFRNRNVHCYSFSPPGGLLSGDCVRDTKSFITTVILGKDIVARIGVNQLNEFKDLVIKLIKRCQHSKWKVIGGGAACCSQCRPDDASKCEDAIDLVGNGDVESRGHIVTRDSSGASILSRPLYPPGQIIHLVYKSTPFGLRCDHRRSPERVVRAIKADNEKDFNEVIISEKMIYDHRPEKVLAALELIHAKLKRIGD